jgi:hypothetical protein
MGIISFSMHALERVVMKTVHNALVIQMVKQPVNFSEKGTQIREHVYCNSSMFIEHIINPLQHRIKNYPKVED